MVGEVGEGGVEGGHALGADEARVPITPCAGGEQAHANERDDDDDDDDLPVEDNADEDILGGQSVVRSAGVRVPWAAAGCGHLHSQSARRGRRP